MAKNTTNPDLIKVRTINGGYVHVLRREFETPTRMLLRRFNPNGKTIARDHDSGLIHRDNLDPDGKRTRVINGGQSIYGNDLNGYPTQAGVKRQITRLKQNAAHYRIKQENGRWIGLYVGPAAPETSSPAA